MSSGYNKRSLVASFWGVRLEAVRARGLGETLASETPARPAPPSNLGPLLSGAVSARTHARPHPHPHPDGLYYILMYM